MDYRHETVMLHEAVDGLAIQSDGIYIDATYGRGGHSQLLLSRLGESGKLIAIDQDSIAVNNAKNALGDDTRFNIEHCSFSELESVTEKYNIKGKVNGILFDLGVSSPQLDDPSRGFSFMRTGPLDMRMDTSTGQTAAQWLQHVSEKELTRVLKEYGEERFAKRIASAIVTTRKEKPIETTEQLVSIVLAAVPKRESHKHPATRTFLAIRLVINKELEVLTETLEKCIDALATGGRLVVISFHSLEDRIAKRFIRKAAQGKQLPRGMAVLDHALEKQLKVVGKAVKPSSKEITENPRARSAVLRIAEKIS